MNENKAPRRQFLKVGGAALVMIPALMVSGWADGATNVTMRAGLKYQGKPEGDKSCSNCMQFVPGSSAKEPGGCKVIPGDTEISPQGYCMVWAKKA
jgi:hypothetical protein